MPRRHRTTLEGPSNQDRALPETKTIRCALYTRKSTSEGLDQAFNTLDAQREAAEAYVASQKHAGWTILPQRYDDGGYSGGSIDRPALKKLLEDVEAGSIDCVVVYKVDRLSRSLLDFARMMKLFEDRGVHFVSVTQHFNTAESMGRLTLNILLSFAQFEREIIGERIRDKIAASRRRGKWSGGNLILGYDLDRENRRLVVNEAEAAQVREIFDLYLRHESLLPVVAELQQRGWRTKSWIARNGKPQGGRPFDKGNLYLLLTNVAYLGKVRHKEEVYQGEHEAVVAPATFDRVRRLLERNRRTRGSITRNKYGALLKGLVRCAACRAAMIHCPVRKGTRLWRYYVCIQAQKRGTSACPTGWINAHRLEQAVLDRLRRAALQIQPEATRGANEARREKLLRLVAGNGDGNGELPSHEQARLLREIVERIEYDEESRRLRIQLAEDDTGDQTVSVGA